ncbi:MAG: hypothetical protein IMZ55_00050 [Acidobacteria bacterium]|nr:hypothetical protein [Planctomycetota bacterium]MBE3131839.1 hypothetical protein [Acidobacteriota bacterium]
MRITAYHRRLAARLWECGGRVDEIVKTEGVSLEKMQAMMMDPGFRALLAPFAMEPLLQATAALVRWAPVAVARLIQDLESESATDARQGARDLLRLAFGVQKELIGTGQVSAPLAPEAALVSREKDPLTAHFDRMTDDQLTRILAIVHEPGATPAALPPASQNENENAPTKVGG